MITLLVVNEQPFDLIEAVRRSLYEGDESDIFLDKCIEELLIRQYAAKKGIYSSKEQLQVAIDELRYREGLESLEALEHWLESNYQTLVSLQNGIETRLLYGLIRNSFTDSEIEAYFAEHQLDFDRVGLYSIRLDNQEQAEELYAQITEEGANFHLLAMEHSLDEQTRPMAGYVGKLTRSDLTPEIESTVFNSQPGEVIDPIKTDKGYNLFKIGAFYPAKLEVEKNNIVQQLFHNLKNRLRTEAKIEYTILKQKDKLLEPV